MREDLALGFSALRTIGREGSRHATMCVAPDIMRDYRKLRVFQQAHELVKTISTDFSAFPARDRFGLEAQLRRSILSVTTNIVEGSARRSLREYANFINIALGSACEARYLFSLSIELGLLEATRASSVQFELDHVVAGLQKLLDSLDRLTRSRNEPSTLEAGVPSEN